MFTNLLAAAPRLPATELWCIYHLPVLSVPTNKPRQTKIRPLRIFSQTSKKWQALIDEIIRMQRQGQPVLVGVRSVTTSQYLANLLWEQGFDVALLNAEQDAVEANIIADAGRTGRITNMAGRGTDICLDEVPWFLTFCPRPDTLTRLLKHTSIGREDHFS